MLAYFQCHLVHLLALLCGDLPFLIVVLPRGKHQQLASGTCLKLFAMGLGEWREAVFHDDDGGEAGIEGGSF